jgi:hypothetical protein
MAKCLNCEENAVFLVQNQGALAQEFCDAHLPKMFNKLALPAVVKKLDAPASPFAKIAAAAEAEAEAVREKAKAKKKAAPVAAEEPVVEDVPAEETPAEETPAE